MKLSRFYLVIFIFMLFAVWYYRRGIYSPISSGNTEAIPVTVEAGQGISAIASTLKEEGLIRSTLLFKIYIQLHRSGNSLQAGDYELSKGQNVPEMLEVLQHGTFDRRLTFLEGWRREEMADYLGTIPGLNINREAFLQASEGKEGRLFPDTYVVPRYISAADLVGLMESTFNQKVTSEIRDGFLAQGLTFEEGIILASIVEREVMTDEDRALVAGILLKRHKEGWPLQADATTQYALGFQANNGEDDSVRASAWWKQHLTVADLEIDSAYNTRRKVGFPPTPICSPGIATLAAVARPEPSDYWYYLTGTDGTMHYAVTLDEHNANIANYLQ